MKQQRTSIAAMALSFAVLNGCTQPVDTEASQSATGDVPRAPTSDLAESTSTLLTDWSGNVQTLRVLGPETGWNSHNTAYATVPPGWVLVGGGFEIDPGTSDAPGVLVTASYPFAFSKNTWTVSTKDHIYPHSHKLRAMVLGLKLAGLSADQLISQMETVGAQGPQGSSSEAIAQLSSGMLLVGGGAAASYSGAGHLLTVSQPWLTTRWRAASKDHDIPDMGTVFAYAIGIKQCPVGFLGGCLTSRIVGKGVTCGGGFCDVGLVQSAPTVWAMSSIGAASTYNGAGRLLTRLGIGDPLIVNGPDNMYTRSKDHKWSDTGMLFAYLVELAQFSNPPH